MSQYPQPYGYGQYQGQHPPQPYAYQNAPGYPAPGQNTPYNPSAAQTNRDVSQASYELNATHIPGLGIGGTTPVGAHHNPASGPAFWTQPPDFPTSAPHAPPPHTYGASSFNSQRSPPGLAPSGPSKSAKPSNQHAPTPARPTVDDDIEEGELSEGQFEDLYEPRDYVQDAPVQAVSKVMPTGDPSQPTSVVDTPDGGFYGTDEDDGGKDARGNEGRERSASYSPFLSPREVQSGIPTPQPVAGKGVQAGPGQSTVDTSNLGLGLQLPNRLPATAATSSSLAQTEGSTSQSQKGSLGPFKSLQEAKKEAQKAILRLWPLGVKYQNYIDEGFDEKLIKGLFGDLHLDMPKTAADSPATQLKASQPKEVQPREGGGHDSAKPSQTSGLQSQQATSTTKGSSAMSDQARKGEERKDRIARLLAAKAVKAPAAPKPSTPATTQSKQKAPATQAQETVPTPSTSAPPKSKTWGEKERLIQQKIAALQKSREAQKSVADATGLGAVQVGSNGTPNMTGSPTPLSIPTGPKAATRPQRLASAQSTPSQPLPPIPGLVLSPNAQPNMSSQRKRPVASDFVEYSSESVPLKRPFGQARTETSLIIDVSDESDDEEMDMDMDMDMGSPDDETLPIQSGGIAGQRGPAIRDFPPLTDTLRQRQFSSPAPSVTPPSGLVNNKKRGMELNMKEKEIQDMRRKIALAEARRKVKQYSGGSVTPRQPVSFSELKQNGAPSLPPTESAESMSSPDHSDRPSPQITPEPSSARLPKPSEMSHLEPWQRANRRGRIMSLEIPRVESSLTEKLSRLQQLQDEQARLKAEIDTSLAEQKRLADELQQLDTTPPLDSQQSNGLDPDNGPDNSFSSHAVAGTGDQQEADASILQTGSTLGVSSSTSSTSERSQETGDVSMNEVESSGQRPQGESPPAADHNVGDSVAESASDRVDTGLNDSAEHLSNPSTSFEPCLPKGDAMVQRDTANASVSSPASQPAGNMVLAPSIPEQVDAANADETTPMELDSRSPSPEPVSSIDAELLALFPDQISNVAQPREAMQEIEAETTGEVNVVSSRRPGTLWLTKPQMHDQPASKPVRTLMPYESPLRYFHAYRFHPEYQHAVTGGLRSLTYSNRIDPEKELCPAELTGEQCPADCEFQHFNSISPPDDQILVELGKSDDYTGEQKSRFIQGLRELLQKFKADKVRDFDTIARGIIEFRSQLLGDKSKVLYLEGVSI
ncbi:hypothetical protein C8A00DRAFT_15652 [Chaetomidium leptoderma]|uniref:Putative zinc-finger domain-containing protein n=1 Tax=Chaetomidium leptoderma TaxID=669021 RepID=A0AAN6VLS5_9PEZI|nr:hypothetical protein C8A00DRAFT_15652 [Chaetomidium leptoderma]